MGEIEVLSPTWNVYRACNLLGSTILDTSDAAAASADDVFNTIALTAPYPASKAYQCDAAGAFAESLCACECQNPQVPGRANLMEQTIAVARQNAGGSKKADSRTYSKALWDMIP